MSRIRSPNYPAMSLPAAIDRVRTIHKAEGKNGMTRDVMAKHLGFGSINGASAAAMSALGKYGLVERANDGEMCVSDLAMRILYPHSDDEKRSALHESAFQPVLFAKIREKWPERPPSDESLRAFLVRDGFSAGAVDQIIQIYRETLDIAGLAPPINDARSTVQPEHVVMPPQTQSSSASLPAAPPLALQPPPPSAGGKPFTVSFDGAVLTGALAIRSVRDIDRLMKVLQAQKAAFEAMRDEWDDDPGVMDKVGGSDEE